MYLTSHRRRDGIQVSILHIMGLRTQRNQLDLDSNTTKSSACSWDTQHVHPQLVTWRELCEEEWGAQGPLGGPTRGSPLLVLTYYLFYQIPKNWRPSKPLRPDRHLWTKACFPSWVWNVAITLTRRCDGHRSRTLSVMLPRSWGVDSELRFQARPFSFLRLFEGEKQTTSKDQSGRQGVASQIALQFFPLKQIVAKCQKPHIFPVKQSLNQPGHFKLRDLSLSGSSLGH